MGARIRLFGVPCQTRHELSEDVSCSIERVYLRQAELDRASRLHKGVEDAMALLYAAREESLRAQRLYDAHLREHGCMQEPKTNAATA